MNTPYLDNLRGNLVKQAGGLSNMLRRLRLGREFPRLALYQQLDSAKKVQELAKLRTANKWLSVLGGAGGLALLLNLADSRGGMLGGLGKKEPPVMQPPTVIHY